MLGAATCVITGRGSAQHIPVESLIGGAVREAGNGNRCDVRQGEGRRRHRDRIAGGKRRRSRRNRKVDLAGGERSSHRSRSQRARKPNPTTANVVALVAVIVMVWGNGRRRRRQPGDGSVSHVVPPRRPELPAPPPAPISTPFPLNVKVPVARIPVGGTPPTVLRSAGGMLETVAPGVRAGVGKVIGQSVAGAQRVVDRDRRRERGAQPAGGSRDWRSISAFAVAVGGLMVPAPSCSGTIPAPVLTTPLTAG